MHFHNGAAVGQSVCLRPIPVGNSFLAGKKMHVFVRDIFFTQQIQVYVYTQLTL